MNHNHIINALESILPDINSSGDAEGTLLKYASTNNLAPAQLEKMGQAFNTAKTVVFLDKSANRAGTFNLLDVDGMVSKYASATPAPVVERTESISDWLDTPEHICKAASGMPQPVVVEEPDEYNETVLDVMKRAMLGRNEMAQFAQVIEDHTESMAAKLASIRDVDKNTLLEDVLDLMGEDGLRVLGATKFSATAKLAHVVGRLPRDRTGHLDTVKAALADLEIVEGARRMAGGIIAQLNDDIIKAAVHGSKDPKQKRRQTGGGAWPQDAQFHAPKEAPADETPTDTAKTDAAIAQMVRGLAAWQSSQGSLGSIDQEVADLKAPKDAPQPEPGVDDFEDALAAIARGQAAGKGGILDVLGSDFAAAQGAFGKTHNMAKGLDAHIVSKTQGARDGGKALLASMSANHIADSNMVNDNEVNERAALAVQELMVTDPVISQYDEDEVVEVANAIGELNPSIMGNPVLLRTVLREALQYDSAVPMHVQTDLAKLYDSIQKGRQPARKDK